MGVMWPLPFRRLAAPIACFQAFAIFVKRPLCLFVLAYGFLSLDLPGYFQRLSFGWRELSFELLVVHLVTSLRFSVGRKIARKFMRQKGRFLTSSARNSARIFLAVLRSFRVRGRGGPGWV